MYKKFDLGRYKAVKKFANGGPVGISSDVEGLPQEERDAIQVQSNNRPLDGSSPELVKEWQKMLNQRGYNLAVDGKLGNKTYAALQDLQSRDSKDYSATFGFNLNDVTSKYLTNRVEPVAAPVSRNQAVSQPSSSKASQPQRSAVKTYNKQAYAKPSNTNNVLTSQVTSKNTSNKSNAFSYNKNETNFIDYNNDGFITLKNGINHKNLTDRQREILRLEREKINKRYADGLEAEAKGLSDMFTFGSYDNLKKGEYATAAAKIAGAGVLNGVLSAVGSGGQLVRQGNKLAGGGLAKQVYYNSVKKGTEYANKLNNIVAKRFKYPRITSRSGNVVKSPMQGKITKQQNTLIDKIINEAQNKALKYGAGINALQQLSGWFNKK